MSDLTLPFRIGQGYDVHRFKPGDHITLGGVKIPHNKALEAHSDGDVLLHALCDALLGAAALGDIGQHFPDSDAEFSGADSRNLLRHVVGLLAAEGWQPVNVDSTVIAQRPKVGPHISAMRSMLSEDLKLPVDAISIKATTTEKLGFTGREEGIAADAVVLISRVS